LTKATPLLLVGIGICSAFRSGVINIGGEGQIIVGATLATAVALALRTWPGWLLLPITLASGALAGAIWGGIAGLLKARLNVNEILTTIMLNQIALQLMNFLLRSPMLDPKQVAAGTNIPQSAALPEAVWLTRLVPRTLLHSGLILAVVLAILVYLLLWRTTIGYRIRAVGLNAAASRYAGIPVAGYLTLSLVLSGAFAGLAGAVCWPFLPVLVPCPPPHPPRVAPCPLRRHPQSQPMNPSALPLSCPAAKMILPGASPCIPL